MEVVSRKERRKRFWQQELSKKAKSRQERSKTTGRSDGRKPTKKSEHSGKPNSGKTSRTPDSHSQKLSSRGFRPSALSIDGTQPLLLPSIAESPDTTTSIVDSGSESSSEREPENTVSESAAATATGDISLSNVVRKNHKSKPTRSTKSKTRERKTHSIRRTIVNSEPSKVSQSQTRSVSSQTGSEISETENETERPGGGRRYILFVGNLPYSVGEEDVVGHFKKRGVALREVRMLTGKDTDNPRGCCFMELDGPKTFQNALRLHHTVLEGRKINVEMTCGGGGGSEGRRTRITRRNKRLLKMKTARKRKLLRKNDSC